MAASIASVRQIPSAHAVTVDVGATEESTPWLIMTLTPLRAPIAVQTLGAVLLHPALTNAARPTTPQTIAYCNDESCDRDNLDARGMSAV